MNEILLVVGNSIAQLSIDIEKTEKVNTPIPSSLELLNISAGFCVVILNLIVLKILTDGEKTVVNKIMIMDCLVNSLYSVVGTFQHTQSYKDIGLPQYCLTHLVIAYSLAIFNRLSPIAIGLYRYL